MDTWKVEIIKQDDMTDQIVDWVEGPPTPNTRHKVCHLFEPGFRVFLIVKHLPSGDYRRLEVENHGGLCRIQRRFYALSLGQAAKMLQRELEERHGA